MEDKPVGSQLCGVASRGEVTVGESAVSFLLLLPGLNQHGVITKYACMAKREINKLLKQKEKKNE